MPDPTDIVIGQELASDSTAASIDLTTLHAALAHENRGSGPARLRRNARIFFRSTPYVDRSAGIIGIVFDHDSLTVPAIQEIQQAFRTAVGSDTDAFAEYCSVTTVEAVPLVTDETEPFVSGMGEITL